jgi:hypothetical protein
MNTSFLQDVWYFPLADIYELYQAKGFTEVTGEGLLEGKNLISFNSRRSKKTTESK